jgi:serine-type D-Ala-D-Ala carboxypeptidase (penicillin-binding protein 5/6)
VGVRAAVAAAALALAAPALAAPPSVEGRAYLVQNAATGEVLLKYHSREKVPIASITKLMTVLVTLEHARLDDVVTVGREAAATGESTINLSPGERLTVGELVEAALIQSANDAAVALAEYVGRGSVSRFVAMMNAKARELGLTDTHFANPDGLDQTGHYSSARDVTTLAEAAMRLPFVRKTVRRTDADIPGRHLHTWNDLLFTFPHLLGVKTGHTTAAGWSEVAAAAGRDVTIYATLLGEPSRSQRNDDLAALLAWGLSRYRVVAAVGTGRTYAKAVVPYGRNPVELVAARSILRVVRVDRTLVERVVAPAVVSLPVTKGQPLGEVEVFAGGKLIARAPLVAARSVSRPGLAGRVGWYLRRAAHNMWKWFT